MPPAKIFMGDVGSISLGFLAGTLSVVGISAGVFDVWVPILIFSPFIVDATATLFRRLFQWKKIWLPHREHYYQRLVLSGWGRKKTIWAEYVLMCVCGCGAILYAFLDDGVRLILLCALILLYAGLMFGVRVVEWEASKKIPNQ
jgi:UDP-N-acetylmuramyl pentapeptide phosphotransferase/UDP-N-acetylglucosamine-1-phosphate transferase